MMFIRRMSVALALATVAIAPAFCAQADAHECLSSYAAVKHEHGDVYARHSHHLRGHRGEDCYFSAEEGGKKHEHHARTKRHDEDRPAPAMVRAPDPEPVVAESAPDPQPHRSGAYREARATMDGGAVIYASVTPDDPQPVQAASPARLYLDQNFRIMCNAFCRELPGYVHPTFGNFDIRFAACSRFWTARSAVRWLKDAPMMTSGLLGPTIGWST